MIDRGTASLLAAQSSRSAVGAFTSYTIESTVVVCAAAAEVGVPAMLQAGSGCFSDIGRGVLASTMLAAAGECPVPIGVHLDHARSLEEIRPVLDLGFSSVMIDGSALPFDDNVELTRAAVSLAHEAGAWIEGELGVIAGQEDVSVAAAATDLTDPVAAAAFVEATGVDALAIAIGNVHGMAAVTPEFDLAWLRAIGTATPVPLVLHGASGVPPAALRLAILGGPAKINVNTELRRAHLAVLRNATDADDITCVRRAAILAIRKVAGTSIRLMTGHAS